MGEIILPKNGAKGRLDISSFTSTLGELIDSISDGRTIFDFESMMDIENKDKLFNNGSTLLPHQDVIVELKSNEVRIMDDMMPPWGIAVLEGPSVESIRSWYFKSKSKGAVLFHIPFDSFNPRGTPESRARFGVTVVQVSSFIKKSAIASLRPDWAGGRIPQKVLPEPFRLEFLRIIAEQGFAWFEIEQEIEEERRNELIALARRSGSKILLTHKMKEGSDWTPPEDFSPEVIDGYRITIDVRNSNDLRRMINASKNARGWAKGKKVVIEPSPISEQFVKVLGPISLSDMVPWTMFELENYFNEKPSIGRNRQSIWRSLGLLGNDVSREWSIWKRGIDQDTQFYLQIGNVDNNRYRSRFFNTQFNKLSMDALMIPWNSDGKFGVDCIEMAKRMGIRGAMVEMPLRTQVIPYLDWIDPKTKLVGGVDTLSIVGGRANGYNSELYGIGDMITKEDVTKGSKTLILGTGLSGRAAAVASRMLGMDTYLAGNNKDRTLELAVKLDDSIKGTSYKALTKPGVRFDLIINSIPFDTRSVKGGTDQMMEIADIVKNMEPEFGMDLYFELQWTPFLSSIESRGGKAISGVETLVMSSLRSFKLITGKEGSEEQIRDLIQDTILMN